MPSQGGSESVNLANTIFHQSQQVHCGVNIAMDTEILICFVQERSVVCDPINPMHRNRDVIYSCFMEGHYTAEMTCTGESS